MGVCVLSVEETARLEKFRIFPACKSHKHVSKIRAQQMLSEDTHRTVGGAHTEVSDAGVLSMIVEIAVRGWEPVAAAPGVECGPSGMRVWGNAPSK